MGLFAAVELAKRGLDVVGTVRDTARASALLEAADEAGVSVSIAELEVTDPAAGDRLAAIAAEHDGIDVLINNAGRAIADAATSDTYRFRWQTSEAAERFAGISLADLDGSRVRGVTAGWIAPTGPA
jgi:NAD(P)-dependent dehydrogenase (short-subunit alcohol dehydrogenase family)